MVFPLIGYGLVAVGTAVGGYFLSTKASSSQEASTEQTSKSENKLSSALESAVTPTTKTTSTTNNISNFDYNFSGASVSNSMLDLGKQTLSQASATSPKVDAKVGATSDQGTTTTPTFTATPTQTAENTSKESLLSNPLVLAGLGVGGYLAYDSVIKGGKKK